MERWFAHNKYYNYSLMYLFTYDFIYWFLYISYHFHLFLFIFFFPAAIYLNFYLFSNFIVLFSALVYFHFSSISSILSFHLFLLLSRMFAFLNSRQNRVYLPLSFYSYLSPWLLFPPLFHFSMNNCLFFLLPTAYQKNIFCP